MAVYSTAGLDIRDLRVVGDAAMLGSASGITIYSDLRTGRKLERVRVSGVDVSGFKEGVAVGAAKGAAGFRDVRVSDSVLHGNRESGLLTYGPDFDAAAPAYAHRKVVVSGVEAYGNFGDPTLRRHHAGDGHWAVRWGESRLLRSRRLACRRRSVLLVPVGERLAGVKT